MGMSANGALVSVRERQKIGQTRAVFRTRADRSENKPKEIERQVSRARPFVLLD